MDTGGIVEYRPASLQQGIDDAGSAVALLWRTDPDPWLPARVPHEFRGWQAEQTAWRTEAILFDLSYHMTDAFIEGPDATRLLSDICANDFSSFATGRAKQFIAAGEGGNIVMDGILLRESDQRYTLVGHDLGAFWAAHFAREGGYDVDVEVDPQMQFRPLTEEPRLFRIQVQGPAAIEIVERAFGGPLPEVKFFHSTEATLQGRRVRALRHGMAGQAGYEFIGPSADHDVVRDALLAAGETAGIIHGGALSYATTSVESGWLPAPTPAIYTAAAFQGLRDELPLFSYAGQNPLSGSFYSDDITDFYCTPWEIGYGRSIALDHDFVGRDALAGAKDTSRRTKVTLVIDADDARRVIGGDDEFFQSPSRHRVERDGALVGVTFVSSRIAPVGTVLAVALVESEHSQPGTRVDVAWGQHPGPGTRADADLGFPRLRATVQPSPYDAYARSAYRAD